MSILSRIILVDLGLLVCMYLVEKRFFANVRNKQVCNVIRGILLFVWAAGIVYVSFFYDAYSHANPCMDFVPFRSVYQSLINNTPLSESRLVIQLFLYLPLGMFIAAIDWKRQRGYGLSLLVALSFCMLIEAIQFRVFQKDIYLDDVIGGSLGILSSQAASVILKRRMQIKKSGNAGQAAVLKAWYTTACTCFLACTYGLFFLVCLFQLTSINGMLRYCSMRIPVQLEELPKDAATNADHRIFAIQSCDNRQLCEILAIHFGVAGDIEKDEYDVAVHDPINGKYISVLKNGTWTYINDKIIATGNTPSTQDTYQTIIENGIKLSMRSGETIVIESTSADTIQNHPSMFVEARIEPEQAQHDLIWNNSVFVRIEGETIRSINYRPIRCTSTRSIRVVSAETALKMSKHYGEMNCDPLGTGFVLDKVECDYCSYRGEVYPCYIFSGTYIDKNGVIQKWESIVDAVDRGILPYIIPISTIAIALSAILITIRKTKRCRSDEEH